jgi:hypothetical protein
VSLSALQDTAEKLARYISSDRSPADAGAIAQLRQVVADAYREGQGTGRLYVVSPYYGGDSYGEPEAVYDDRGSAEVHESMGDLTITEFTVNVPVWDVEGDIMAQGRPLPDRGGGNGKGSAQSGGPGRGDKGGSASSNNGPGSKPSTGGPK